MPFNMKILYRAIFPFDSIEEVQITSETKQFVILPNGIREKKSSDYSALFETKEHAKQAILTRLIQEKEALLNRVSYLEKRLEKANNI